MSEFRISDTVGDVVARRPELARLFEAARIDYCCGGKKTLAEVCREQSLDPLAFLATLDQVMPASDGLALVDAASMSLTELVDHIVQTHHAYLREELPRLNMLTERVASVHGADDPRLRDVRETFLAMADELTRHMMKEEQVLFPMIREVERSERCPTFHCGSIANPIRQMGLEHQDAGEALERMRTLTDEYTPPTWSCNTYRAMLIELDQLEQDMHQHVHKEDNVLYPRALQREAELAERANA